MNETNAFALKLLQEKGIMFLYDLSYEIEKILKKKMEEFAYAELMLPCNTPIKTGDSEPELTISEKREMTNFEREYAGYDNVRKKIEHNKALALAKFEKDIRRLSYGRLMRLAFEKSKNNYGLDALSFMHWQVKELAREHNVSLDTDEKCPVYVMADDKGLARITDVIDQVIGINKRESTFGILEYVLDKAVKEIEFENEAKYLLTDNDDKMRNGGIITFRNESDQYNDRGTIKGVKRHCDLDDVDDGLREEY